jgi:hypothetical protein
MLSWIQLASRKTEILGVDLLKRGGNYMTLQGEVVSLADTYGLVVGGAAASAKLLKKQVQYRQSHGVGVNVQM